MHSLTERQQEILEFIEKHQAEQGSAPSLREIAEHFHFKSMTAALCHVRALKEKRFLASVPRRARSLQLIRKTVAQVFPEGFMSVPIYGTIPAGLAEGREQESKGCLSIDLQALDIKPNPRIFALEVHGDSMIGKHILDGDYVVLEHGRGPRPGDVVAALIDNESTLKTYLVEKGRPFLRAENPKYPNLIPAQELVIQGVMLALVRKMDSKPGKRKN